MTTFAGYSSYWRRIFFSLAAVFATLVQTVTPAAAAGIIDYDLDLRLLPAQQRIEGRALLTSAQEPLVPPLRLAGDAAVTSVAVDGRPVTFTFQGGELHWQQTADGKAHRIEVAYEAVFNDPVPQDTVGIEDPSFGVRATILPQGAFLAAGVAWFPQAAGHSGRHRVRVTTPPGMLAVTAGRLVSQHHEAGGSRCEWDNTFPLAGLALAAGHYQISSEQLGDIQLLTFLSTDNANLATSYQAAMRRHLEFYRDLLGPYPFAKFAVVENFLPTGYGMPSWTLLGSSVVRLPFLLDTSLPHEIVHSWWGNAVEIDYAGGNWGEGLATYLADYLLKERDQPEEALEYRRKIQRDYAALVTAQNDFPLRSFGGRRAKYQQAIGYGKGALVFHMLRRQIGDQAFWEGLRQMAATGTGRSLSWRDLEGIFSRVSGQELRWFFRQWIEQTGAPELVLDEIKVSRRGKGWKVSGVVLQTEPAYRLALVLRLTDAAGGVLEQALPLKGQRTPFSIATAAPPAQLAGDPDSHLFRRLAVTELPATINDLLAPQRPLVLVATGQDELLPAARDLLKGLHWEHAEIVKEADFHLPAATGRDLLLLGWPGRTELRPLLPAGLTIAGTLTPSWQVAEAPGASDALFAVLAGRHQSDGLRALFLAGAPDAARRVAAKISHYGRYSLLLFANGRNTFKSTWEVETSPLRAIFSEDSLP